MEQEEESSCCQEAQAIMNCIAEYEAETDQDLRCITQHPGFRTVCLDQYVLQTAYLQYRQQFGNLPNYREDE